MMGIYSCNSGFVSDIKGKDRKGSNTYSVREMNSDEITKRNAFMLKNGFIPLASLDCFVKREYGAFMTDFIPDVNLSKEDHVNKYFSSFKDMGYDLVIGPPSPISEEDKTAAGLYCANYADLYNRYIMEQEAKGKSM